MRDGKQHLSRSRQHGDLPQNPAIVLVHWQDLLQGLGIPAVTSYIDTPPAPRAGGRSRGPPDNHAGRPTKPNATPGKPKGTAPMCLRAARRVDDCLRAARRASRAEAAVRAARRRRHLQAVLLAK